MRVRFGRYETLRPIAAGGMASVHLGRALGAGGFERFVAIKAMHPGIAADPGFVAMFLDEGRLAAQIRHPNVVGTIDVQESPDGLFLVMEYVEGPSLAALARAVRARGELVPTGIALRIVADALLGLHAAHEQRGPDGEPLNIIHRDVSPQNILVGVDGLAKITDFGVAHAEARLAETKSGHVKGKLGYMPPQQVHGQRVDRRADVYSAGVVLWELLAGRRLFHADNEAAILFSVLRGPEASPAEVQPGTAEAVSRVCMRALATSPDERYPTALAFAAALEDAAAASGVQLASSRVVAAFVRELGAHVPPALPQDGREGAGAEALGAAAGPAEELEGPTLPRDKRPVASADTDGSRPVASEVSSWALRPRSRALGTVTIVGLLLAGALGATLVSRLLREPEGGAAGPAVTPTALAAPGPPASSESAAPPPPAPPSVTISPAASATAAPSAQPRASTKVVPSPAKTSSAKARPKGKDEWAPDSL